MRGKADFLTDSTQLEKDHPRLCGEKLYKIFRQFCRQGSPPPMRGKGIVNELSRKLDRITPAYAGKSSPDVPD